MFSIINLSVALNNRFILNAINLSGMPGSTHLIMGPNGSGKSTLAAVIMGNPRYIIDAGSIQFQGIDVCLLAIDERARNNIFVGFQHPLEIPGVRVQQLLMHSYNACYVPLPPAPLHERMAEALHIVGLPLSFLERSVNVGFSGGEKKRLELAQMIMLQPKLIILDEIDSGLDIEGLHCMTRAIEYVKKIHAQAIVLIISHNTRLEQHLTFDAVHIMKQGTLRSTDCGVLPLIEKEGYATLT